MVVQGRVQDENEPPNSNGHSLSIEDTSRARSNVAPSQPTTSFRFGGVLDYSMADDLNPENPNGCTHCFGMNEACWCDAVGEEEIAERRAMKACPYCNRQFAIGYRTEGDLRIDQAC